MLRPEAAADALFTGWQTATLMGRRILTIQRAEQYIGRWPFGVGLVGEVRFVGIFFPTLTAKYAVRMGHPLLIAKFGVVDIFSPTLTAKYAVRMGHPSTRGVNLVAKCAWAI
jgi:hypothetical protein